MFFDTVRSLVQENVVFGKLRALNKRTSGLFVSALDSYVNSKSLMQYYLLLINIYVHVHFFSRDAQTMTDDNDRRMHFSRDAQTMTDDDIDGGMQTFRKRYRYRYYIGLGCTPFSFTVSRRFAEITKRS